MGTAWDRPAALLDEVYRRLGDGTDPHSPAIEAGLCEARDLLEDALANGSEDRPLCVYLSAEIMKLRLDLGRTDVTVERLIGRLGEAVATLQAGTELHVDACVALADELAGRDPRAPADLDDAIDLLRDASRWSADGEPAAYAEIGYRLGVVLAERSRIRPEPAGDLDRDEAIDVLEPALAEAPDAPWAPEARRELGLVRQSRWIDRRDRADLEAAIGAFEALAAGTEPAAPDEAYDVLLLGLALNDRYEVTGLAADLDAAAERLTAATSVPGARELPLADVGYATLGDLLATRGDEQGSLPDLDAAVTALVIAVELLAGTEIEDDVRWRLCATANARADAAYDPGVVQILIDATTEMCERTEGEDHTLATAMLAGALGEEARHQPDPGPYLDPALAALTEACALLPPDHELRLPMEKELGIVRGSRGQYRADAEDLRAAIATLTDVLERWPADDPEGAAEVAGGLATSVEAAAMLGAGTPDAYDGVIELLTAHDGPAVPESRRPVFNDVLATSLVARYGYSGDRADLDRGIALLRENEERVHAPYERALLAVNLGSALMTRFFDSGELTDIDQAVRHMRTAVTSGQLIAADAEAARSMLGTMEGVHATYRRDHEGVLRAAGDVERALARLPRQDPRYARWLADLGTMRQIYAGLTGDRAAQRQATADLVTAAEMTPPGHLYHGFHRMKAGSALVVESLAPYDARGVAKAIAYLRESAEDPSITSFERHRVFAALGNAHYQRYDREHDPADLEPAIHWLGRARALMGDWPDFGMAVLIEIVPARAYRARATAGRPGGPAHDPADARLAREHGLAALRVYLRQTLLQSGSEDALHLAADAADDALAVAGWCLADGEPEAAMAALELGRGLVLYAATTVSGIGERLRAVGEREMAEAWERSLTVSGGPIEDPFSGVVAGPARLAVPDDLRTRVIRALTRPDADATRLVDPPAPERVAESLRHTGMDALVYLISGADGGPGHAIVVPASGRGPEVVPLPALATGPADRLSAFTAAERALRDAADDDRDAADARWREALDRLCEWAGDAALGPLLDGPCALSVTPRLVLVPVGRLGRVPWHAARIGGVYAVERAVISYAATARQYVEVAARESWPAAAEPVIVVNPTGDLQGAANEAEGFVRCHPGAVVLGLPTLADAAATAPGTPDEVLARLPGPHGPGASVLHLACHGRLVDGRPTDSYLLLAGGELSVSAILAQAQRRPPDSPGGLIMPIACVSDLTDHAYDEVLAITTAFLAAGASGTIGTLWNVMDQPASLLTYVFHHRLTTERRTPADALREAQLWMLDPERRPPRRMPVELAMAARGKDLADVASWAGFTHQGR